MVNTISKQLDLKYFSEHAELIFPSEVFSSDLTAYHKNKYKKKEIDLQKKGKKNFFLNFTRYFSLMFLLVHQVFFFISEMF